jgi:uncharacterized protein (DUF885 family)
MRAGPIVGALFLLSSACVEVRAPRAPGEASPRATIDAITDAVVSRPSTARSLGLRDEFDGKVADYSEAGILARAKKLDAAKADLAKLDASKLGEDEKLDVELLRLAIEEELFQIRELETWRRRPQYYEELFALDSYLTRDYAPFDERARRLFAHVKASLPQTHHIEENLKGPLPEPFVKTDIGIYRGYAEYLGGDVVRLLADVKDATLREEAIAVVKELAARAAHVADYLEKQELPRADKSYILGAVQYARLLEVQEALRIPLPEFERMAEQDLARNKAAYEALMGSTKVSRPPIPKLLETATSLTFTAKVFLEQKKLVTLPPEGKIEVKETPPFMQWNSAFLDGPGPFDRADLPAYYYITLPDPSWPAKEQEEYVMPFGTLLATSVHEVFPGHFLHGQWIRRAPTRTQKMLASYSFVEGWAHYGEQLMIEQGFGADDPQSRLGQLGDALLRNCRFVVSIGLHTKGMTLEQAEERFVKDCFQDRATAKQQAYRGTFDPGYFAYTLGKIQILELRAQAEAALGPKFDNQRFHDALLAHGAPPVPLIRERVLRDIGAAR